MKYEVCIPSYSGPDGWVEVDAFDAEDAARDATRRYNEEGGGEYFLTDSSSDGVWVLVREKGSEDVLLFNGHAEVDIHYGASEQKGPLLCKQCNKDCTADIFTGKDMFDNRFCGGMCYKNWLGKEIAASKL